jgi:hypothetical protein
MGTINLFPLRSLSEDARNICREDRISAGEYSDAGTLLLR